MVRVLEEDFLASLMVSVGGIQNHCEWCFGRCQGCPPWRRVCVRVARADLEAARHAGYAGLDTANAALVATDETTQAVLNAANETLRALEHDAGAEYVAPQAAIEALEVFKRVNEAVDKVAIVAIENLLQNAQYIAYEVAMNVLEVAKSETSQGLKVIQEVVNFGLLVVDIQLIQLSGSLRGVVGLDGKVLRRLAAKIRGLFLGKPFELEGEFTLSCILLQLCSVVTGKVSS
ncbi:hypothetical protein D9758_009434 [Tetrapyrgos nigripes]|uniref:Uncharacterized protein n=1 Tax=Tetrapyrgos nigripes TaxID=182062 RepID=A0A8H5D3M0_9AGAR|nr:hypothetical protein D9758_009434 [Tetrapyrgos nigripes]